MGPPWWVWVIGIVLAVLLGLGRAALRGQAMVVNEFIGHLQRLRPQLTILRHDAGGLFTKPWFAVRTAAGAEITVDVYQLFKELATANCRTQAEKDHFLERWLEALDLTPAEKPS
jgi:hypothetical protein